MKRAGVSPRARTRAVTATVPAPIGGWNARDALPSMAPTDAVVLDNFIPRSGYVELRRGYVPQVVGFGAAVETLLPYRGGAAGTDKLFAASGGGIYDVSTQGATLGAALISGKTSNRWNYISFANAAGPWTIAVNGADAPIGYNGGAWANLPALSGSSGGITLTPSTLFNVFSHYGRLFYLQQNSLYVWIPAAGAVGGACSLLDLSSIFNKGGRLVCGATWSTQLGFSLQELAVFVTDQGQAAIYSGTDPTNASAWSLIGVSDLGPPLGPRAIVKYGGDLALVTADGIVPLSRGVQLDRSQEDDVAITSKIVNAFSTAVRAYQGNYGWQGLFYPGAAASNLTTAVGGSLAIFNIPITTLGTSMQFVQNVLTGAWCSLLNINAFCWEMANGKCYFGGATGVYQWDAGSDDNGVTITGLMQPAFSRFGSNAEKQFLGVRPLLNVSSLVSVQVDLAVDYAALTPTATPIFATTASPAAMTRFDWTACGALGVAGSPVLQASVTPAGTVLGIGDANADVLAINVGGDNLILSASALDVPCQVIAFDVTFEAGGVES